MNLKISATKKFKSVALSTAIFCSLLFSTTANAVGISFIFDFTDPVGTGFNDVTSGTARQNAMITAGNLFSDMFSSHFSNMGTLVINATASDDSTSSTLASAGSEYFVATPVVPGFNSNEVVREKLISGVDLNGAEADGTVNVNFGQPWQLDPNATVAGDEFDFFAAVFHEFTHALGFASNIDQNGADGYGYLLDGNWVMFDRFLTDVNGNDVVDHTTFDINQSTWDFASVGGTSPDAGLFFSGPNALAANGGIPIGIFSPIVWENGSSGSHLDTNNPLYAGMMMVHDRDYGSQAKDYSGIEVGILKDLGYTAASAEVPEPSTYVLFILGLLMIAKFKFQNERFSFGSLK